MYNRSEPSANCGLWVTTTCQCRYIHCDKCTNVVGDVIGRGGCAGVGRGIWELSLLSAQFCCELKMSLKNIY